ncbi:MAG: formimidoylglutamate deiminase [Myxococcota bacterium]
MPTLAPDAVLTASGFVRDHVVVVDNGLVTSVTKFPPGPIDVPLPGRVLIPGLVNAHSHAFQRALRGQLPDGSATDFWHWRDRMYALVGGLDPNAIEAISALAFTEMAESGITHVGEFHYVHHQPDGSPYADPDELAHRVIAAARRAGIRITLLRVAYERNGDQPLHPVQRRFIDTGGAPVLAATERLRRVYGTDEDVIIGLAPHSVRAVPPSSLRTLASFDGVIHTHVSEQPAENAFCHAQSQCSPTQLLADCGLVHDRFTAVHLTWPEPGDVDCLVAARARVCVCPSTELDLADGFLPVDARRRLPLCLGSDSHATIDLFAEARTLEGHGRAQSGQRGILGQPQAGGDGRLAWRALVAASAEGARALGLPRELGVTPGDPADLVAIDLTDLSALGVPPLEAIIGQASPRWVDSVWVGGTRIVAEGRHVRREAVVEAALQAFATSYRTAAG